MAINRPQRDMTDAHLRRCLKALGFRGEHLPMSIAEIVVHPQRPNDSVLVQLPGERKRDAVDRLRRWAWGNEEKH